VSLSVWPSAATGQEVGTVAGTVTTMDDAPLAQARITVVGTTIAVVSGADGRFYVPGVSVGNQILEVRMLGYSKVLLPVEIHAARTLRIEVVLTAEPVPLEPVEVKAAEAVLTPPGIRAFEARRAKGGGTFLTREEILRMQPRVFTDVLRRIPGLQIRPVSGAYGGDNLSVQTHRGDRCPLQFYVNGAPFRVPGDVAINHFVAAEDVVAVEVYHASQVPSQYNTTTGTARCGVILVWTRSGPETSRSR
jgi:hypothetical protein